MLFENYINIVKNNEVFNTDLFLIKNIKELINFIDFYDKKISFKIRQNEAMSQEDCLFLNKNFEKNFYDFIIEKIEDDNINFNDDFGIVIVLVLKKNNTVYKSYSYISDINNINFEDKINNLISKINYEIY